MQNDRLLAAPAACQLLLGQVVAGYWGGDAACSLRPESKGSYVVRRLGHFGGVGTPLAPPDNKGQNNATSAQRGACFWGVGTPLAPQHQGVKEQAVSPGVGTPLAP